MSSNRLKNYIEQRIKELGLSTSELIKNADIGRQTYYNLTQKDRTTLPKIKTITSLARALNTHPMYLYQLMLSNYDFPDINNNKYNSSYNLEKTGFVSNVIIPHYRWVKTNETFKHTWQITNVSGQQWSACQLKCVDDPIGLGGSSGRSCMLLPTNMAVAIDIIEKQELLVTVEFTAPAFPCALLSYWKLVDKNDNFCFPKQQGLSCLVQVMP